MRAAECHVRRVLHGGAGNTLRRQQLEERLRAVHRAAQIGGGDFGGIRRDAQAEAVCRNRAVRAEAECSAIGGPKRAAGALGEFLREDAACGKSVRRIGTVGIYRCDRQHAHLALFGERRGIEHGCVSLRAPEVDAGENERREGDVEFDDKVRECLRGGQRDFCGGDFLTGFTCIAGDDAGAVGWVYGDGAGRAALAEAQAEIAHEIRAAEADVQLQRAVHDLRPLDMQHLACEGIAAGLGGGDFAVLQTCQRDGNGNVFVQFSDQHGMTPLRWFIFIL